MKVIKYTVTENITLLDRLFFKGDEIYIQSYDPVNGSPQKCFLSDRTYIGEIRSDFYWDVVKNLSKDLEK